MVWRILFVAALLISGTFGLFTWSQAGGADLKQARTVAVNAIVVFEVFYLLNCRVSVAPSATRSGVPGRSAVLISTALVVALQLLYTYTPPLQALFDSAPLDWHEWPPILLTALFMFVMVELEKAWRRRRLAISALTAAAHPLHGSPCRK